MRKYFSFIYLLLLYSSIFNFNLSAQTNNPLFKSIPNNLNPGEISSGLKQALILSCQKTTDLLSQPNGFFNNPAIKILMPPEAKKVELNLRNLGMGNLVDKTILAMNHAAELATRSAEPIFLQTIQHISIQDGWKILNGGSTAATEFLKNKTYDSLTMVFRPIIESSLEKVNANQYWSKVFNIYNRFTFNKINPNLTNYVTSKTLDGLFLNIGIEEKKIRENQAATANSLLNKVFSK